jgi:hypothetical protein
MADQFYFTKSGTKVNISELCWIYRTVEANIEPGMTEADVDRIRRAVIDSLDGKWNPDTARLRVGGTYGT